MKWNERDRKCPYVERKDHCVYCNDYWLHPERCKKCGWNPEEHARRVKLLRSGKVKTFLHINLDELFIGNGVKRKAVWNK